MLFLRLSHFPYIYSFYPERNLTLSNAFLHFLKLSCNFKIRYITLINFEMLNHPCIHGIMTFGMYNSLIG